MQNPRESLGTLAFCALALLALLAVLVAPSARAADWPVLDPDALTMTAERKAPSAPAIYLYRQVDRDDRESDELNTLVIKILTDAGRKWANVRIVYDRANESITGIEARTIQPDGTILNFDGTVYDAPILKGRDAKIMAKSFTFPAAQVGSVIEYRFRRILGWGYLHGSEWLLEDDLFTRHGIFTLKPNPTLPLAWSWPLGLPEGSSPPENRSGRLWMEVRDVPAFVTESNMPPESALKCRVSFNYHEVLPEQDTEAFWQRFAKRRFRQVDLFVDHHRAMNRALIQIIAPADPPELRLRKIYERVQHLRNLDFLPTRSAEELEREKTSDQDDAADVWNRGYGDGFQITWLFIALARAAGLQADPVLVSTRDRYFFDREMKYAHTLNDNIVRIQLGGKEIYADPGTPFAPLGLLPWYQCGVTGLLLAKHGGTWIKTPMPSEHESRVERSANLALSDDGSLAGRLTVTWYGLQALTWRLSMRNEDATSRQAWMEREVKSYVPLGVDVMLARAPDWSASSNMLRAEFDLRLPEFAEHDGERFRMPLAIFRAEEGQMLTSAERVHPIYFKYPYSSDDTVVITPPTGYQPTGLPDPIARDAGAAHYRNVVDFHDGQLTERRHVDVMGFLYLVKAYPLLHQFFQSVRAGDEEQVVLTRRTANVLR